MCWVSEPPVGMRSEQIERAIGTSPGCLDAWCQRGTGKRSRLGQRARVETGAVTIALPRHLVGVCCHSGGGRVPTCSRAYPGQMMTTGPAGMAGMIRSTGRTMGRLSAGVGTATERARETATDGVTRASSSDPISGDVSGVQKQPPSPDLLRFLDHFLQ